MLNKGMMNIINKTTTMIFFIDISDKILPIFDYLFIAFSSYSSVIPRSSLVF